ncbi:hypothetical protein BDB01DRAFT_773010, partial [Pilobolus umbonatus]
MISLLWAIKKNNYNNLCIRSILIICSICNHPLHPYHHHFVDNITKPYSIIPFIKIKVINIFMLSLLPLFTFDTQNKIA